MKEIADRQYYLDWVRVFAFFLLIFFHCAMPFVVFGWEIKNAQASMGLSRLIIWLHQWRLPLLFFISGTGISFSLRRRSVVNFAGERFVRLFIPLAFAMLFTVPLQVYYEWMQTGRFRGSYAAFYPSVWKFIPYPEGSLTWSHMWFVVYLFVFCVLLLPVFALFKIRFMQAYKVKIANFFSTPVKTYLLCLPLILCYIAFYIRYPEQQNLVDDWFLFTFSLLLLSYGYVLGSGTAFWENCLKYRFHYLVIALICIIVLYIKYWWNLELPSKKGLGLYAFSILNSVQTLSLICAILGFAKKHLNKSTRFLKYTNKAVYPFYILHQTIIVVTGYYVVQWPMPIIFKLLIMMFLCFLTIVILFQYLVRPFMLTRILFGLKAKDER